MTIQVECPCGQLLRVGEQARGKKARCPACGSIIIIPKTPSAASKATSLNVDYDRFDDVVATSSKPIEIRTPAWLLYFGLLTAAAILWGTIATWKLQERTIEMMEAQKKAEAAESAAKGITQQAEEIKKEATRQAEGLMQKAEGIMKEAEVAKLREDEQLYKIYPNLRKIVAGENAVNERYLESFWLSSGSLRVKLTNKTTTAVKPSFSMRLIDKNGMDTGSAHISWLLTSIEPGETHFDEQSCFFAFGPPVYYTLDFR